MTSSLRFETPPPQSLGHHSWATFMAALSTQVLGPNSTVLVSSAKSSTLIQRIPPRECPARREHVLDGLGVFGVSQGRM